MNSAGQRVAISTVAWVVLAIVIVVVGGSAAYFGTYDAVKASNPSTTTVIQIEVSDVTRSTSTITPSETVISIDQLSVVITQQNSVNDQYNVTIEDVGTTTISGTLQLYFTDATLGTTNSPNCNIVSSIATGQAFECSGTIPVVMNSGDTITLKVVTQEGAASTSSTKVSTPFVGTTLTSATLLAGTENSVIGGSLTGSSYFTFAIDSGSATNINGITMTGSGISSVTNWETTSGVSYTSSNNNALPAGHVSSFTFYPYGTAQSIVAGQVYNYVINFANGQSVSGSLIAQ